MKNLFRPLLVACSLAALAVTVSAASLVGMDAPALSLKDLDGKPVSLAALKGKVVVVDFWATWCGPCQAEIPGYIELQKKYADQGLVIVGVSLDTKKAGEVKKFVTAKGMNYPVAIGSLDNVDAFGGFEVIPTTFLIGRDGKVLHQKSGAMDHAEYEAILKKAL